MAGFAGVCSSSSFSDFCSVPIAPEAVGLPLFQNDDACGDWSIPLGYGAVMQPANSASAAFFVMAGLHVLCTADTATARRYGVAMCVVGCCSCSFHATSSAAFFFVDIVPMAVTAGILLYKGVHALQARAGICGGCAEDVRLYISIAAAVFAVFMPCLLMHLGFSHSLVWAVWALLFGSMGVTYTLMAIAIFAAEGIIIGKQGRDILISIVFILLGLGCTIHSFIPGLCTGWRAAVPLHAGWHFFSAVCSNRLGCTLDSLTQLVACMEGAGRTKKAKHAPLLVRMVKDFLPSQFSM